MVLGLFGSKSRYRWQDTESITSEHDDIGWLSIGDTWDLGVLNVFNGVGASSVFSNGNIIVVGNSVGGIVNDVLENRTEFDGSVNLGFLQDQQKPNGAKDRMLTYLVLGEVDSLGITSTLNVEDTSV